MKTTNPKKYCVRPNTGIVSPRSSCDVIGAYTDTDRLDIWFVFVRNSICYLMISEMFWCWFSYHASTERGSYWHAMQGQVSPSECKNKWWCVHKGYYPGNGKDLMHCHVSLWVLEVYVEFYNLSKWGFLVQ